MDYLRYFLIPVAIVAFLLVPLTVNAQRLNISGANRLTNAEPDLKEPPRPARVEIKRGDDKQIDEIEQSLIEAPNDWARYNELGVRLVERHSYGRALEALKRATEINPRNAAIFFNLSVVYEHLDRRGDAIAALRRSLSLEPGKIKAYYHLCELTLQEKSFGESADCFQKLIKLTPNDPTAHAWYAYSLLNLDKTDEAAALLDNATCLFPDRPEIHNGLGMVHFMKKQYVKAAVFFRRVLEIDENYISARFNLAIAEVNNRNRPAAAEQYRLIKNIDPALALELYKLIYGDIVVFADDR